MLIKEMAVKVFTFLTLAVTLSAAADVNRTARVECYDNLYDYTMVFTVTSNSDSNLGFVYAINSTDDKIDQCSSEAASSSYFTTAPDLSEFKITINVTKDYVPDAECGHTNNSDVLEWRFLTTKFSMIVIKSIDILFVAKCNFSEASSTVVSTGTVTVAGDLSENAAPDETISFGLSVVGAMDTALSTVQLGQMVKLKITQLTGRAVNMTGHSCWASSDNLFSDADYKLVESTGCPVDLGDGTSLVSSGFVGGSPSATTGTFEQFKFVDSNSVYYQCMVVYCFTGDSDCDDYCTLNSGVSRRKRDAEDSTQAEVTETSVKITLNELPIVNDSPVSGCPPEIVETFMPPARAQDAPSCLNNTGVIAVFGAMGGMLILTAAVAVLVYLRSAKLSQMAMSKSA